MIGSINKDEDPKNTSNVHENDNGNKIKKVIRKDDQRLGDLNSNIEQGETSRVTGY